MKVNSLYINDSKVVDVINNMYLIKGINGNYTLVNPDLTTAKIIRERVEKSIKLLRNQQNTK